MVSASEYKAAKEKIAKLDEEMLGLQGVLADLLRQADRIRSQHATLDAQRYIIASSIAPVHSIPHELLGRIFFFAADRPPARSCGKADRAYRDNVPFVILQVSRKWHDVCIGTPDLWSWISITTLGDPEKSIPLRLQRSKAAPLHINITMWSDSSHLRIKSAMDLLRPHVCRWKTLRLAFDYAVVHTFTWETFGIHSDVAEILEFIKFDPSYTVSQITPFPLTTPQLHTVSYEALGPELGIVERVSRLELGRNCVEFPPWDVLTKIRCLKCGSPRSSQIRTAHSPKLPQLEELTVGGALLERFLRIDMPSLLSLTVKSSIGSGAFPLDPGTHYSPLSSLREFHLSVKTRLYDSDSSIVAYLRLMPSLTTLAFTRCSPSDREFLRWAERPKPIGSAAWVCPCLQALRIIDPTEVLDEGLKAFVQSRTDCGSDSPAPLREWYIKVSSDEKEYTVTQSSDFFESSDDGIGFVPFD